MDADKRRTRFQERVRVERDFLAPINQAFGKTAQLTGMTKAAIASWQERASAATTKAAVQGVARILLEASRRAELLADNSRDVFVSDRLERPDGLDVLKTMLLAELHEVSFAGPI